MLTNSSAYVVHSRGKKSASLHVSAVHSVTQMLTTQADRFTPEEVTRRSTLRQVESGMKICSLCTVDGADVRCLPSRCGGQPGLQEPGAHHHPRRGEGPGVNVQCGDTWREMDCDSIMQRPCCCRRFCARSSWKRFKIRATQKQTDPPPPTTTINVHFRLATYISPFRFYCLQ